MDPNHRLDLATRIHFSLLEQLGVAVAVEDLLGASPEGREALWVCEANDDPELQALAHEFLGRSAPLAMTSSPPRLSDEVRARRSPSARPALQARAAPVLAPANAVEAAAPEAATPQAMPPAPRPAHSLPAAAHPAGPGRVPRETAWSDNTSGFGLGPEQELQAAPFLPTADALEPSPTAPDISWATALRMRPQAPQTPSWKQALTFWRRG